MARTPEVGAPAPDFTLPGVVLGPQGPQRADYTLGAHRGSALVLAFYPADESPVCTKQLCSYASDYDHFNEVGATVWGISGQDVDSHERFATRRSLTFPLLADTGLTVARAYGVAAPVIGLRRSVFIVDAHGILRWKHIALAGATYRPTEEITRRLAALTS